MSSLQPMESRRIKTLDTFMGHLMLARPMVVELLGFLGYVMVYWLLKLISICVDKSRINGDLE